MVLSYPSHYVLCNSFLANMKVLIVGFGCVSSAFLSALRVNCEIDISVSSKKELNKAQV